MEVEFETIGRQFESNKHELDEDSRKPAHVLSMTNLSEADSAFFASSYEPLPLVAERFLQSGIDAHNLEKTVGLSAESVTAQLQKDGYNELTPPKKESQLKLFFKQFLDPFMVLLGVAGILSAVAYGIDSSNYINIILAGVLFFVVIMTCLMTWWDQRKALKTMDAFRNILGAECTVIRGGRREKIPSRELVTGDIVELISGQKVPADVRLLYTSGLKVENAAITGEAEPIELDANLVSPAGEKVEECRNVAFNGSLVLDGEGRGVVLATGDRTVIGKIAVLTTGVNTRRSTMEIEVSYFVRFIAILSVSMAVLFFVIAVGRRQGVDTLDIFINGFLVIIVANVPQGLPATVTSLQLIVAKRLATKNVFVKRLDAIETLGAVTVIASDKTGTLTMGKMHVVDAWVNKTVSLHLFVDGGVDSSLITGDAMRMSAGTFQRAQISSRAMRIIACVCNTAVLSSKEEAKKFGVPSVVFSGNPSEVAMVNFFEQSRPGSVQAVREAYPVLFQIPFSSATKYHATVVRGLALHGDANLIAEGSHFSVLLKGAPEVVLKRCNRYLLNGEEHPLDQAFTDDMNEVYTYFAKRGQRVLGFCCQELDWPVGVAFSANNVPLTNFVFVGLLAIMDPPRDDVPLAIDNAYSAGIKVFMVTGDHPTTAAAIATQIGLVPPGIVEYKVGDFVKLKPNEEAVIVHGQQIDSFSDEDWEFVLSRQSLVFARTTPQHKLTICEHCQARGEIVCVTGDGVNDAPALKRANIGVSMGINGSEVAREASDVILTDDNFASIVLGVEQGRLLYDNLKKTIGYTLAHLPGEILPIFLTLLFGFPPFLTSLQILSVDLLTELAPAISLAYEKKEKDIMTQRPRNVSTDRLVSAPLLMYSYLFAGTCIIAVGCFLAACTVFWINDIDIPSLFLIDGQYFVSGNPFIIIPNFGDFCSGSVCYNNDEQVQILLKVTGAYYILLVGSQVLHIWMVKTRRTSFFLHGVSNMVMNYGVCIEIAIMICVVAIPGFSNNIMGTSLPINAGLSILPLIYTGGALWLYNELRKLYIRHRPKAWISRKLLYW